MQMYGWKTRFSALALSAVMASGASSAMAEGFGDAEIVAATTNTDIARQAIDGIEVNVEWTLPDDWVAPDGGDGVAFGLFDTMVTIGFEIWDRMTDGDKRGGGGGSGDSNTNTCSVTVSGASVVVIGNVQC